MSYIKATDVLPEELMELIQNYVDGEYIYIPRKEENKISWGEHTQSKKELLNRNERIFTDYLKEISIHNLSEKYYLSPKTLQRIISEKKKMR